MDSTVIFDKHTQLEHIKGCEILFQSLHKEHNIQFDDEGGFKESAKKFMDILDKDFPKQSDRKRVGRIHKNRPDLKQTLGFQNIEKNLDLATKDLRDIHHQLSSLKEGYDGLEKRKNGALWLRDWLEVKDQVFECYEYAQEAIQLFKSEVQELTIIPETIVAIRKITLCHLMQLCDEWLEKLSKY